MLVHHKILISVGYLCLSTNQDTLSGDIRTKRTELALNAQSAYGSYINKNCNIPCKQKFKKQKQYV